MKQRGKRYYEYEKWKIKVAIPYLVKNFGRYCNKCGRLPPQGVKYHDVDHIITRGSRPDLKMSLDNVQFLCRKCHSERK